MSTPRSKPVKRYSYKPGSGFPAPDGTYMSGLFNHEMAAELGMLAGMWTHLEEQMIVVLRHLLGTAKATPHRQQPTSSK
jgi:hypothetical protein